MSIPKVKDMNLVAVYGTLKKKWPNGLPYGNHAAMTRAGWEFVKEAWVEFSHLNWGWFPIAKFADWTDKLLKVELYNVSREWVLWPLDSLEGHPREREDGSYADPTFYVRKEVTTTDWDKVIVYEYVSRIEDASQRWKLESDVEDFEYYEWNK